MKTKDQPFGESSSARKLSSVSSEDVPWNYLHAYRLIEFFTVFTALSDIVICGTCKQKIKFEEAGNRGLGFKLVLLCNCGRKDIQLPFIHTGTFNSYWV